MTILSRLDHALTCTKYTVPLTTNDITLTQPNTQVFLRAFAASARQLGELRNPPVTMDSESDVSGHTEHRNGNGRDCMGIEMSEIMGTGNRCWTGNGWEWESEHNRAIIPRVDSEVLGH